MIIHIDIDVRLVDDLVAQDLLNNVFQFVWKSTSELGYPENYCGDLREPPRHRADAIIWTTSLVKAPRHRAVWGA